MMFNNQPIHYLPNATILETNRQIQSQDHGLLQIFNSCVYNGEVYHAKKKVNFDLFNPLYKTFLFDDVINE
jgi:hypothetical protein